ncbi:uncharacterized protein LTR77_006380 [Saxophila tyrrhenica]|uniref:DUF6314 domain-containing protein n=1 Tax=Saxophila tyrrhenica TaxID=1690608 RepID=A0AAV9P9W3_9PEZI|nr:hypothetical protein LTR77_006380 [Saxophila tyrrhenica]
MVVFHRQWRIRLISMSRERPVAELFRSLRGSWKLKRTLNSAPPGLSGVFEGTATFTPRKSAAASVKAELLYFEKGQLKTDTGLTFSANRKYIYRYNADEDKISAWFVKEATKDNHGAEEVDYLFHDLEIEQGKNVWSGRGEHLCNLDMYWAYYEFRLPTSNDDSDEDEDMEVFGVRYKVKGPDKNYTSDTAYQRIE